MGEKECGEKKRWPCTIDSVNWSTNRSANTSSACGWDERRCLGQLAENERNERAAVEHTKERTKDLLFREHCLNVDVCLAGKCVAELYMPRNGKNVRNLYRYTHKEYFGLNLFCTPQTVCITMYARGQMDQIRCECTKNGQRKHWMRTSDNQKEIRTRTNATFEACTGDIYSH